MKYKTYSSYIKNVKNPMSYQRYKKALYEQMDKDTKQKVLDLIRSGKKFGEVCEISGVSVDEVCCVFEENIIQECMSVLNREAK